MRVFRTAAMHKWDQGTIYICRHEYNFPKQLSGFQHLWNVNGCPAWMFSCWLVKPIKPLQQHHGNILRLTEQEDVYRWKCNQWVKCYIAVCIQPFLFILHVLFCCKTINSQARDFANWCNCKAYLSLIAPCNHVALDFLVWYMCALLRHLCNASNASGCVAF